MGLAEFKLLSFLVNHPDRVYSRAQLLDSVWGDHVFIEERTVDVHVLRLRKALTPARCTAPGADSARTRLPALDPAGAVSCAIPDAA